MTAWKDNKTYTEECADNGDIRKHAPILTLLRLVAVTAGQTAQQLGDAAIRAADEVGASISRGELTLYGNT